MKKAIIKNLWLLALVICIFCGQGSWAQSGAIMYLSRGVDALKIKDYKKSKELFQRAIDDAESGSEVYYMAHSWMGQWYSVQAMGIRTSQGDLDLSVKLSIEAERYFDLALSPEKRLKEQLSRASALEDLARTEEAETLLRQVMTECENVSERRLILGKAAYKLGEIEVNSDRFQQGIAHLEQSYDLCKDMTSADAKSYAYMAANKLSSVYLYKIPDTEKESQWQRRAMELEPQILKP